jgi:hypothetical protein
VPQEGTRAGRRISLLASCRLFGAGAIARLERADRRSASPGVFRVRCDPGSRFRPHSSLDCRPPPPLSDTALAFRLAPDLVLVSLQAYVRSRMLDDA